MTDRLSLVVKNQLTTVLDDDLPLAVLTSKSLEEGFTELVLVLLILEIPITVHTHNNHLSSELVEKTSLALHTLEQVASVLTVRVDHESPEVIQLTLKIAEHIADGVAASFITAWILKKLGPEEAKVTNLQIDRVTVELGDKEEIRRVLLERIRKKSVASHLA